MNDTLLMKMFDEIKQLSKDFHQNNTQIRNDLIKTNSINKEKLANLENKIENLPNKVIEIIECDFVQKNEIPSYLAKERIISDERYMQLINAEEQWKAISKKYRGESIKKTSALMTFIRHMLKML